jgi:phosphoglycolate phosphatase-like HAD superfamily hydrolase
MTQSIVYALDFDGVICDSAVETGVAGWKAASQLWSDMPKQCPPSIVNQFCQVRPVLETGYEAIFVIRLLFTNTSPQEILNDFNALKNTIEQQLSQNTNDLKRLFGQTRDQWIQSDPDDWLSNNPLFEGVQKKLAKILAKYPCYIVTTKQERFVQKILSANNIHFSDENIYGLERKLKKEAILLMLQQKHSEQTIYFFEDRLPPLLDVQQHPQLKNVQLFFADWGYNTDQDRQNAIDQSIQVISLQDFLSIS